MVRNAHANLMARDTRIVEDRPVTAEAAPVFLVGAGPSLDRDLAHLKRLRDRAVVVSCGTALPLLLANGVRPDFHCEMERVPLVPTLLKEAQGAHGFDGITLIAAATTHPEACALFEHVWLYHRAAPQPVAPVRRRRPAPAQRRSPVGQRRFRCGDRVGVSHRVPVRLRPGVGGQGSAPCPRFHLFPAGPGTLLRRLSGYRAAPGARQFRRHGQDPVGPTTRRGG